jgi:mRNA interferase MazF
VITRDVAIPLLANVTLAMVTTTDRGLPTEVRIGPDQGVDRDCVVSCDNLVTLPKRMLGQRLGQLDVASTRRLDDALRLTLELD